MVLICKALLSKALYSVDIHAHIHTATSELTTQGDSQLVTRRLAQGHHDTQLGGVGG